MGNKKRLDVMLYERGLAESRERAKALIMSGIVYVNGIKEDKAGASFEDRPDLSIEVRGKGLRYVSRGGLKLEKAVNEFGISLEGLTCMDIGASTGGFTDCMLQNGAKKVFAVDVGHGQLAWSLRNDSRVVCLEKTNIRYITKEAVDGAYMDFASVDVSFISLKKVLPAVKPLLTGSARMVCLIKPQFEAGREEVGKKGVVRDQKIHMKVIGDIVNFVLQEGFEIIGLTYSPIKGPEGNIEYLIYIKNQLGAHSGGETVNQADLNAPCNPVADHADSDNAVNDEDDGSDPGNSYIADNNAVYTANVDETFIENLVRQAHAQLDK